MAETVVQGDVLGQPSIVSHPDILRASDGNTYHCTSEIVTNGTN